MKTSSKSTKLKCQCDTEDTESFCMICCPESYECLKEAHIQKYIQEKLNEAKPTKHQIGDKVWVLGNRKIEQRAIYGVCLFKDYVESKEITLVRYELELSGKYNSHPGFFYTEDLLFTTREALIDSLCSEISAELGDDCG